MKRFTDFLTEAKRRHPAGDGWSWNISGMGKSVANYYKEVKLPSGKHSVHITVFNGDNFSRRPTHVFEFGVNTHGTHPNALHKPALTSADRVAIAHHIHHQIQKYVILAKPGSVKIRTAAETNTTPKLRSRLVKAALTRFGAKQASHTSNQLSAQLEQRLYEEVIKRL